MKFRSPYNISGASQQHGVADFSEASEVDGDLFLKTQNNKLKKKDPQNDSRQLTQGPRDHKLIWNDAN